jgi:hypothetical protein
MSEVQHIQGGVVHQETAKKNLLSLLAMRRWFMSPGIVYVPLLVL